MIEQQGRVLQLTENEAAVRVGISPGCPACKAGKGCGAGIFAQLLPRKPVLVRVPNVIGAHPGQIVVLGIPENAFLRILLRLYLLPLLAALLGAASGYEVAGLLRVGAGAADGISLFAGVMSFWFVVYFGRAEKSALPRQMNLQLLRVILEPSHGSDCQSGRAIAE